MRKLFSSLVVPTMKFDSVRKSFIRCTCKALKSAASTEARAADGKWTVGGGSGGNGIPKETKGDIRGLAASNGGKIHIRGSTAAEFDKLATDHGHSVHHEDGKLVAKNSAGKPSGEFHPDGRKEPVSASELAGQARGASVQAHTASIHANGGWNHGTYGEAHNRGEHAAQDLLNQPKMESANDAKESSDNGQHGFASHFHHKAAELHDQQAANATDNTKGMHEKAAKLHRIAADAHHEALRAKS